MLVYLSGWFLRWSEWVQNVACDDTDEVIVLYVVVVPARGLQRTGVYNWHSLIHSGIRWEWKSRGNHLGYLDEKKLNIGNLLVKKNTHFQVVGGGGGGIVGIVKFPPKGSLDESYYLRKVGWEWCWKWWSFIAFHFMIRICCTSENTPSPLLVTYTLVLSFNDILSVQQRGISKCM